MQRAAFAKRRHRRRAGGRLRVARAQVVELVHEAAAVEVRGGPRTAMHQVVVGQHDAAGRQRDASPLDLGNAEGIHNRLQATVAGGEVVLAEFLRAQALVNGVALVPGAVRLLEIGRPILRPRQHFGGAAGQRHGLRVVEQHRPVRAVRPVVPTVVPRQVAVLVEALVVAGGFVDEVVRVQQEAVAENARQRAAHGRRIQQAFDERNARPQIVADDLQVDGFARERPRFVPHPAPCLEHRRVEIRIEILGAQHDEAIAQIANQLFVAERHQPAREGAPRMGAFSGEREGNPRMKRALSGGREGNPRMKRALSGEREGNPRMSNGGLTTTEILVEEPQRMLRRDALRVIISAIRTGQFQRTNQNDCRRSWEGSSTSRGHRIFLSPASARLPSPPWRRRGGRRSRNALGPAGQGRTSPSRLRSRSARAASRGCAGARPEGAATSTATI